MVQIEKRMSSEKLFCVAGHHRLVAFLNVCDKLGRIPEYECSIFDNAAVGADEYLKKLAVNICGVPGVPDYFSVIFDSLITPQRLR
jgi:hypothetical protein